MTKKENTSLWLAVTLAIGSLAGCAGTPEADTPAEGNEAADAPADVVGDVRFETTCADEVRSDFNQAVARLHSFEFEESRGMFEAIAAKDPDCAMASWGVAMTHYHPLWAPPTPEELRLGAEAVAKARTLEASEREKLYIEAIGSFYDEADSVSHRERAVRYENAMAALHEEHPEDQEAEIFYALSMLSNVDPTDKTYEVQKRAGAMLEPMFAEMPNHPGLAHYIIHSYDYPALADQAVDAAHRYLDIATSMPHALHMSGHIFTQLGMWEDSIDANTRSAEAARERGERFGLMQAQMNEMHALDYLVYAYLQRGEDEKAKAIVEDVTSRSNMNWKHGVVTFNAGAVPVRYAMERHDWEAAADLATLDAAEAAGGNYESRNSVALRYWARAIGKARTGEVEEAEKDLAELTKRTQALQDSDNVWARNTAKVFELQATGWIAHAKGENDRAVELLKEAAALESQTDKSGLSPGRVLPAHEQLGDLLLELGRADEALAAYEASMKEAPERFDTYLGAARAAKQAGNEEKAGTYYGKLLALSTEDSTRAELDEARAAT